MRDHQIELIRDQHMIGKDESRTIPRQVPDQTINGAISLSKGGLPSKVSSPALAFSTFLHESLNGTLAPFNVK
jgi:hypothetical protein